MVFNRAKKYYFKGDGFESDSSNGLVVETFICNITTPAEFHYFLSDIKTLVGASILQVNNESLAKHISLVPPVGGPTIVNGGWKFKIKALNEDVESPTDIAPLSENAGISGPVTLNVMFFGLIN